MLEGRGVPAVVLGTDAFISLARGAALAIVAPCTMDCLAKLATGITDDIVTLVEAYTRLHEQGDAHSVECWRASELVGGIYGVSFGGFFAGESMFHRVTNASTVALSHLVEHLRNRGFTLFDTQMVTPATRQLGAIEISRTEYLTRLKSALALNCSFA